MLLTLFSNYIKLATKKRKSTRWPDKRPPPPPKPKPDMTLEKFGLITPTFNQMTFLKELISRCNCYKCSLNWLPIYRLHKMDH